MSYHVLRSPKFDRDAKKLIKRDRRIAVIVDRAIEILSVDPYNFSRQRDVKKLQDMSDGIYRIRFGDYRIRYDVDGKTVVLARIRHRKEVYEYRVTDV